MSITCEWRGEFDSDEVDALHGEGFGHAVLDYDWKGQVEWWSLGWVCARDGADLVGFVNVPWDGATHAFILDTLVSGHARRQVSAREWLPSRRTKPERPGVNGCTSTSRTRLARSISTLAGSNRPRLA